MSIFIPLHIASVVVSFPLMYQSASAAFGSLDSRMENAARTMGGFGVEGV